MDLYELRLDQPHPGTRDGDPGHGRVCQLPHPPRARAGRAPGAVAGTASRDESSMSDRARAQVTTPEALPDERLTDAALRPSRRAASVSRSSGSARSEEHTSELQSPCNL